MIKYKVRAYMKRSLLQFVTICEEGRRRNRKAVTANPHNSKCSTFLALFQTRAKTSTRKGRKL